MASATIPGGWVAITALTGHSVGDGTGTAPGIPADGAGAGAGTTRSGVPAGMILSGDLAGTTRSGVPAGTILTGMADGVPGTMAGMIPGTVLSIPVAAEYGVIHITVLAAPRIQ